MVYKVDVNTGAETLVRTAGFKGLTINDLRKLVGASNQQIVLNLLSNPAFGAGNRNLQVGSPVSYIVPDALLYRELEVSKVNKTNLSKLPVVKNPLEL